MDFQELQGGEAGSVSGKGHCGVLISLACLACCLPGGVISCMHPEQPRKRKGLLGLSCSLTETYEK